MPLTIYQQAFALLQSTWLAAKPQPSITRADLKSLITGNIEPAFASYDGALAPQQAWHVWDDYVKGPLDTYMYGPQSGIQQLLPPTLFERLCCMLSSTNDARIPLQPFSPKSDVEGLWYYGFRSFTQAQKGKAPQLSDQICHRGIGPNGELILRSRPIGTYTIDLNKGFEITAERTKSLRRSAANERCPHVRLTPDERLQEAGAEFLNTRNEDELDERSAWDKQCVKSALTQLLKNKALGCDSRDDANHTRRPRALDFAITLPCACACELEKSEGVVRGSSLMLTQLLKAHVLVDGAPVSLFSRDEQTILANACPWPQTPQGMATVVTCAIVRCLLGGIPSIYEAILEHFGFGERGQNVAQGDPFITTIASWGDALAIRAADDHFTYNDLYVPPAFEVAPGTDATTHIRDAADANPACFIAQADGDKSVRLLVQAGSGMGKTTYMRGLTAGIAQNHTEGDATLFNTITQSDHAAPLLECIPVFIAQPDARSSGRGFDMLASPHTPPTSDDFAALLYRQLPLTYKKPFLAATNDQDQVAEQLFCERLKAENALVIVDSIDEVPLAVRSNYLAGLARLVEDYGIRKLIVTSRPLSDADEDALEQLVRGNVVKLLAFDHDRQLDLFCRLSKSYATWQQPTGGNAANTSSPRQLFERIVATPGFAEILGNPLMLTSLVRALAREREPRAFNTLDAIVSMLPKLPDQDSYDDQILSHIAFDLTSAGASNDIDEQQFLHKYRTYWREARGLAPSVDASEPHREHILDRMITRRGILTVHQKRIGFEYTIVRALYACRYVLDTLTEGVTDTLTEEQFDRATSCCLKVLVEGMGTKIDANPAARLTLLLLLSAWSPYASWLYEKLQTSLYEKLCALFLFAEGDNEYGHAHAEDLLRASHTFDFGNPCPRTQEVSIWESRLVLPHERSEKDCKLADAPIVRDEV